MASRGARRRDDGSAIVEFTLVSVLVVTLFLGIVQLAITLHVRNLLTSSASEGARLAALADRSLADGGDRAEELIASALGGYPAQVTVSATSIGGAEAVTVTVTAPVPVFGFWGVGTMTVQARALEEVPRG